MSIRRHVMPIEPLSAGAFRRYGDVIEASDSAEQFTVNQGCATRYHDLAKVDVAAEHGHPVISIFRAQPCNLPLHLRLLERHPIGSQAFIPMGNHPYLVVVAAADTPLYAKHIRCFRASPGQGVNFARGTWHHPVLPLHSVCDFLVIDRGGPATLPNCEEHALDELELWIEAERTHQRIWRFLGGVLALLNHSLHDGGQLRVARKVPRHGKDPRCEWRAIQR